MREPAQVFVLLESLYAEFDKIAKRRGVFKVEVIGDCYVAVVGVPDPRKNHATVMTLFAHACIQKMAGVMNQLSNTLGDDTRKLSLRVGMASGPVTGGVLRGEKGRFQVRSSFDRIFVRPYICYLNVFQCSFMIAFW